ncbi:hypothetical protein OIU77_029941 [Salix suchowensis]|uniref:Galactokinase N-terminal domain-containing protein n=1 Tax=Salix suchowensis TaxID=1278906 RepID=A0ABQ9BD75_9ROSI|nr:hypothetical protein OIU77_029941 [Salix suchowensis]
MALPFLMYQITSKLSDALILACNLTFKPLRRGGTVKDWNYLKVYLPCVFINTRKDSKTMSGVSWPRGNELNEVKEIVSAMAGRGPEDVRVVVSPYRICPLGAHIDHQGGTVSAMTINKGILLGFIPSDDTEVILRSGQFKGEVRFSVDEVQQPKPIRKKGEPHATDSPQNYRKQVTGEILQEELSMRYRAGGSLLLGASKDTYVVLKVLTVQALALLLLLELRTCWLLKLQIT